MNLPKPWLPAISFLRSPARDVPATSEEALVACRTGLCAASIPPMSIRIIRCKLGPLIGLLVPWNALVGWAPPDLDGNIRVGLSLRCNVLPSLDRIHLIGERFVRGYTSDGCLGIRENGDFL